MSVGNEVSVVTWGRSGRSPNIKPVLGPTTVIEEDQDLGPGSATGMALLQN